jgi:hypothetical protein
VAARRGVGSLLPWLGIALIVILLDQVTKTLIIGTFRYNDSHTVTSFFNLVRVHNTGAAFSFLAGAGRLAALVLHRPRRGGGGLHRLDAAQPWRADAVLLGPRADPRRRARQRHRPPAARLRGRLHPGPLAKLVLPVVQRRRQCDHLSAPPC